MHFRERELIKVIELSMEITFGILWKLEIEYWEGWIWWTQLYSQLCGKKRREGCGSRPSWMKKDSEALYQKTKLSVVVNAYSSSYAGGR
jgi:hypothetical protein